MEAEKLLKSIYSNKKHHIENKNAVFKSCCKDWIIVLEKCDDTRTNESRKNVCEPDYAKFRGDKFKVLEIFNKFDCESTKSELINSAYGNEIKYEVSRLVLPNDFDLNINKVCSSGIHYFKTVEPAFYWDIMYRFDKCAGIIGSDLLINGEYKLWHENGNIRYTTYFRGGYMCGPAEEWYEDGRRNLWNFCI